MHKREEEKRRSWKKEFNWGRCPYNTPLHLLKFCPGENTKAHSHVQILSHRCAVRPFWRGHKHKHCRWKSTGKERKWNILISNVYAHSWRAPCILRLLLNHQRSTGGPRQTSRVGNLFASHTHFFTLLIFSPVGCDAEPALGSAARDVVVSWGYFPRQLSFLEVYLLTVDSHWDELHQQS